MLRRHRTLAAQALEPGGIMLSIGPRVEAARTLRLVHACRTSLHPRPAAASPSGDDTSAKKGGRNRVGYTPVKSKLREVPPQPLSQPEVGLLVPCAPASYMHYGKRHRDQHARSTSPSPYTGVEAETCPPLLQTCTLRSMPRAGGKRCIRCQCMSAVKSTSIEQLSHCTFARAPQ